MTVGVLLCLIIITGRIIIQKSRDEGENHAKDEPKFHKSNTGETTITKSFSDNISEVEGGDIDLTTPIAISNLPMKSEVSAFCYFCIPFKVPQAFNFGCCRFIERRLISGDGTLSFKL